MIEHGDALAEILKLAPGSLVQLFSWDGEGAGPMGTWLVGGRTLWDISDFVPGPKACIKSRAPSKLYSNGISRHSRVGSFISLPTGAKVRILKRLRRLNAEGGDLERVLREGMTCVPSSAS